MTTLKKFFKMSSFSCIFISMLNLSMASANMGEGVEVELPVDLIKVQAVLDEGTQVELSEAQVEEMLPWAQNSKVFLEDLLERVKALPLSDKFDQTVSGIKNTVLSSAPKNTELLMRYVLNRSLKVVEVIDEQVGSEKNTSTLNVQFNMLKDSIKLAIKFYKNDLSFITNRAQSDNLVAFSSFGIKYAQFLYQYTKLVFDASAQYQLMRMTLGFLQWDLYRDQNNNLYAPIIMTINHELSNNPKDLDVSDQEYLKRVRNMKRTYEQQKEKIPDIAKQAKQMDSITNLSPMAVDMPMAIDVKYKVFIDKNRSDNNSGVKLQCKLGTHVVSIFGTHGYWMNSLGLYCSDGSRVNAVGNSAEEIFDYSSLKDEFGFYKLISRNKGWNGLKTLALVGQYSSIEAGGTKDIKYRNKLECHSNNHVITGISVSAGSSHVDRLIYIICEQRIRH